MDEGDELLAQARGGGEAAFEALVAPFRRELEVHCYRMLGSLQDAEDAVQDVLLAAWRALGSFEGRSSVRTWLYRIATNRCLDVRRAVRRRPAKAWDIPGVPLLEPSGREEVVWLEPYPDARLAPIDGPERRYEHLESVSLAFVTALQQLPPRQVAVVLLRDVLGFPAREVAEVLGTTVESVTSALKRARATLERRTAAAATTGAPAPRSPTEQLVVDRFVRAWEAADTDGIVALLADDAFMAMPPMPYRYDGAELIGRFTAGLFDGGRRFQLVPTRANGQPAFGAYLASRPDARPAVGLYVLTLAGDRIAGLTRFEPSALPAFGLPGRLPPTDRGHRRDEA